MTTKTSGVTDGTTGGAVTTIARDTGTTAVTTGATIAIDTGRANSPSFTGVSSRTADTTGAAGTAIAARPPRRSGGDPVLAVPTGSAVTTHTARTTGTAIAATAHDGAASTANTALPTGTASRSRGPAIARIDP